MLGLAARSAAAGAAGTRLRHHGTSRHLASPSGWSTQRAATRTAPASRRCQSSTRLHAAQASPRELTAAEVLKLVQVYGRSWHATESAVALEELAPLVISLLRLPSEHSLEEAQAATLAFVYAKLVHRKAEVAKAVVSAAIERFSSRSHGLAAAPPPLLARLAWASSMARPDDARPLAAVAEAVRDEAALSAFGAQGVGLVAQACARAARADAAAPPPRLLRALAEHVAGSACALEPRPLVHVLRGLLDAARHVGRGPGGARGEASGGARRAAPGGAAEGLYARCAHAMERTPAHLPELPGAELAALALAAAELYSRTPAAELRARVRHGVIDPIVQHATEARGIVGAHGRAAHAHAPRAGQHALTPASVSQLAVAVARAEARWPVEGAVERGSGRVDPALERSRRLERELFEAIERQSGALFDGASPAQLAMLLGAMVACDFTGSGPLLERASEAISDRLQLELTPLAAIPLAWALCALGEHPNGLLSRLVARINKLAPEMERLLSRPNQPSQGPSPGDSSAAAMATPRAHTAGPHWPLSLRREQAVRASKRLPAKERVMLSTLSASLRIDHAHSGVEISPALRGAASQLDAILAKGTRPSTLHAHVSSVLDAMGVPHINEHFLPATGDVVDIALSPLGSRVLIDVLGPTHFRFGTALNRLTALQHARLERLGWQVLPLPWWEWPREGDRLVKEAYLRTLLKSRGHGGRDPSRLASVSAPSPR